MKDSAPVYKITVRESILGYPIYIAGKEISSVTDAMKDAADIITSPSLEKLLDRIAYELYRGK